MSALQPLRTRSARLAVIGPIAAVALALGCEQAPSGLDEPYAASAIAASLAVSDWSAPVRVDDIPGTNPAFNLAQLDGCPFVSRDGKTFYMASARPGGYGGLDIWVSTRASEDDPWGEPVNAGEPINSASNDFCPTLARDGHLFYFASNRPGGCGGADIYVSRIGENGDIAAPENLGCDVNSAADEQGPFPLPERGTGPVLYFSSFRTGGFSQTGDGPTSGDSDIYMSESHGGSFGPAQLVAGVNTAANDGQPNVRRDGLEMFFFSNRAGARSNDIYVATRRSTSDAWSLPTNLGTVVNSAASETRPSLSWDGLTLYFGSTRPGGDGDSDIYVTTRSRMR